MLRRGLNNIELCIAARRSIFSIPCLCSESLSDQDIPFEFLVLHFHNGDLNVLCHIKTGSLHLVNKATFYL